MNAHPLLHDNRSRLARLLLVGVAAGLAMPALAYAQNTGTVTGVVRDAATGAPMKGATALLRDIADSTLRFGAISDADGRFSIATAPLGKTYRLEVAYVGYRKYLSDPIALSAGKPSMNIGDISLQQGAVDVGGVEVTSQREMVVVKADKTVYTVENNPSYTATSVSELLGQIPSVDVDQDGKVSLRGNDNVTIMMNDRPLTMTGDQLNKFLQSLPASTVKDIEIRTTPGAQFDAKYQGGIINIVTRRTMGDLFGGSVNAGGDSRGAVNGGGSLYYNGETLNASIGGGVYRGKGEGSSSGLRVNLRDANERRDQGTGLSSSTSSSLYGYGQIDYKITGSDLASLSFNLNGWSSDYSSYSTHTFYNAEDAVVGRYYDSTSPGSGNSNSGGYNSVSFLLKHTFSPDHTLGVDVSYNANDYDTRNLYSSTYFRANGEFDANRSSGRNALYDNTNTTVITTLNYDNPLSDAVTISAGGKSEINTIDNNMAISTRDNVTGEFVPDPLQSSHYLPKNTIYALYGNLSYRPLPALSLQGGVRLEQANVSAKYASGESIISRDYTNVFPSGSIAYNITEQQSLTLSYRRSIALPDIDALNPTRVKWSDFYESSGNPDLVPEFANSLQLAYSTFWGMGNMFTISPYYSTTEGSIENSQQLINGITYSTYENFNGGYSIGSEMSVSMRPLSWLNLRASGDVYRRVNRGSAIAGDIHSAAFGGSGNGSLIVTPMEGTTLSVNLFFNRRPTVGAYHQSGNTFLSFSVGQRLLDKKLNISFRVNDPFNSQKWENTYDGPDFHTESSNKWTSRFVGLNISYTFGTTPRMETHKQDKSDTKGGSGGDSGGSGSGGGQ